MELKRIEVLINSSDLYGLYKQVDLPMVDHKGTYKGKSVYVEIDGLIQIELSLNVYVEGRSDVSPKGYACVSADLNCVSVKEECSLRGWDITDMADSFMNDVHSKYENIMLKKINWYED